MAHNQSCCTSCLDSNNPCDIPTFRNEAKGVDFSTNGQDQDDETSGDYRLLLMEGSASVEVPFSVEVAYDAFSDLTRQAKWSPLVRKVERIYGENDGEEERSKWVAGMLGCNISWQSVTIRADRPHGLAYKSVKGMRNDGRIIFERLGPKMSRVTMSMVMEKPPRFVIRLLGGDSGLKRHMENNVILKTLHNFREEVAQDLQKENAHHCSM